MESLKKAPSCADMIFCLHSQTTYVLQKPGFPENLFYVATYAKGLKGFLICYYILKIRFKEFNKLQMYSVVNRLDMYNQIIFDSATLILDS